MLHYKIEKARKVIFIFTKVSLSYLRITGRNTRPWNTPKLTMRKNILKKFTKWVVCAAIRRANARNVEKPPLNTAGPMLDTVCKAGTTFCTN